MSLNKTTVAPTNSISIDFLKTSEELNDSKLI